MFVCSLSRCGSFLITSQPSGFARISRSWDIKESGGSNEDYGALCWIHVGAVCPSSLSVIKFVRECDETDRQSNNLEWTFNHLPPYSINKWSIKFLEQRQSKAWLSNCRTGNGIRSIMNWPITYLIICNRHCTYHQDSDGTNCWTLCPFPFIFRCCRSVSVHQARLGRFMCLQCWTNIYAQSCQSIDVFLSMSVHVLPLRTVAKMSMSGHWAM